MNSVSDCRVIHCLNLVSHCGVRFNSNLKEDNNGMDNNNRTSHCIVGNVGHSIGSSGKASGKTPRQRNPQKGLVHGNNDDIRNHYSEQFSQCGVVLNSDLKGEKYGRMGSNGIYFWFSRT